MEERLLAKKGSRAATSFTETCAATVGKFYFYLIEYFVLGV